MVDIDIDVKRAGRVGPALRNGLGEGLEDAGEFLLDYGEKRALERVIEADRVWNKQLKRGFETSSTDFARWYNWTGKIVNVAPHAMIVEKGLAPAGQITGSKPSVQDILPWVDSEVTPNAAAQAKAEKANIGNWDPQLQALAIQYGTADVIAAFAIAAHIKDEGYPGLHFMKLAEVDMRSQEMNVKNKVEKEMNKELRKQGLQ